MESNSQLPIVCYEIQDQNFGFWSTIIEERRYLIYLDLDSAKAKLEQLKLLHQKFRLIAVLDY